MEKRIYFDWAATAGNFDASNPFCKTAGGMPYGNPSSQHSEGRSAKLALEDARNRCASVLNVPAESLYFTSGGTEANSIALFSSLMRPGKGRVISSLAEHASVREGMETLEKMGTPTGRIAVDSSGRVTAETLSKALSQYGGALEASLRALEASPRVLEASPQVRFAAIMSVNNETGAVTDIASLRNVIRKHSLDGKAPIHFHCDLVQAAGKIPIDIPGWEIDSAAISAHKISGPLGIGLLYLKKPVEVFYTGGGQENKIRGGTENVFGALALADCLEKYAGQNIQVQYAAAKIRWNKLITSLSAIKRCRIIPKERLADDDRFSPYILQASFKDIPGEVMARALDDLGFAVSTGSACSTSSPERPVLAAMGVEETLRIEGIRISQGYSTTDQDIDLLLNAIAEVLKFL